MSETPPILPPDQSAPRTTGTPANEPTEADVLALLSRLRAEHRAIDAEVRAILEIGVSDMLKLRRMKKIKLAMKDRIAFLENQLTPDIIA